MTDRPEFLTPVIDRTYDDVIYARSILKRVKKEGIDSLNPYERELWDIGLKGAYTFTDMTRVENNTAWLNLYLNELQQILDDYMFAYGVAKADWNRVPYAHPFELITKIWTMFDLPTEKENDRYLKNILELATKFIMEHSLPYTLKFMNYVDANEIERVQQFQKDAAEEFEIYIKELVEAVSRIFVSSDVWCGHSNSMFYFRRTAETNTHEFLHSYTHKELSKFRHLKMKYGVI